MGKFTLNGVQINEYLARPIIEDPFCHIRQVNDHNYD